VIDDVEELGAELDVEGIGNSLDVVVFETKIEITSRGRFNVFYSRDRPASGRPRIGIDDAAQRCIRSGCRQKNLAIYQHLIGAGLVNLDFSVFKNNYIKRISDSFKSSSAPSSSTSSITPFFPAPRQTQRVRLHRPPGRRCRLITSTQTTPAKSNSP